MQQDDPAPKADPPLQLPVQAPAPVPPPSATLPPATVKLEPEPIRLLPPAGSVDNPVEIDDSEDEVIQSSVTAGRLKKRKKSTCIIDGVLDLVEGQVSESLPGEETPRKRPVSSLPSGSKDLGSTPASQAQASVEVSESSAKPVRVLP
jgi:hypothetical protein